MEPQLTFKTGMAECYVENGILHLMMTSDSISLDVVKEHFAAVQAQPGNLLALPSMTFVSNMRSLDKEARDYVAQTTAASGTPCSAVVIQSSLAKVLVNLFLKINKPPFPTKTFTSKEKATEWIREIVAAK